MMLRITIVPIVIINGFPVSLGSAGDGDRRRPLPRGGRLGRAGMAVRPAAAGLKQNM